MSVVIMLSQSTMLQSKIITLPYKTIPVNLVLDASLSCLALLIKIPPCTFKVPTTLSVVVVGK